mgnify:CR=1 FL=1
MRAYRNKDVTATAIIRGSHKMSYGRFFKEIDKVAGGLFKAGVRKGDVVMLALPNIEQSIIATYACSRIGAIASMIHPKLSSDEFESAVKKLQPKIVFLSDVNMGAYFSRCHGAKRFVTSAYTIISDFRARNISKRTTATEKRLCFICNRAALPESRKRSRFLLVAPTLWQTICLHTLAINSTVTTQCS